MNITLKQELLFKNIRIYLEHNILEYNEMFWQNNSGHNLE